MSQEREITWGIREEKGEIKYGQTKYQDQNRKFETAKDLYGIFFEDINRAGDGGIYPEMIRNRCFEDSLLPEGYTQRADGVHVVTDSGWEDEFNGGEGLSSWVEEDQIEKRLYRGGMHRMRACG